MKATLFLLAATLFAATAASAQTPGSETQPNTSNPAAVPSGVRPPMSNPKGDVTPGEAFTAGAPVNHRMRDKNMTKNRKMRGDKMKKKMNTTM